MPSQTHSHYKVISGAICASLGILALMLVHVLYAPLDSVFGAESSVETSVVETGPVTTPISLSIPTINIEASIQPVGILPHGAIAAPTRYVDVGWYRDGVKPGEQGSAILAGHYDNGLGLAGIFRNLDQIKIGDEISIADGDGNIKIFTVTKLGYYPYSQALSEEFLDSHGEAELRLVTCAGDWLAEQKTYDERLVVFARLVSAGRE